VIIGSGIDVVENRRFERELSRAGWVPGQGVFSSGEIHFCNHSKLPARLFATLFAAKEAALKALGIECTNLSCFRDIEVVRNKRGNLELKLRGHSWLVSKGLGVHRASVAVATNARLSGAIVVLES
jgi:holo-[acyl-carrier protein] synthase